jgi:hypothetical protein
MKYIDYGKWIKQKRRIYLIERGCNLITANIRSNLNAKAYKQWLLNSGYWNKKPIKFNKNAIRQGKWQELSKEQLRLILWVILKLRIKCDELMFKEEYVKPHIYKK